MKDVLALIGVSVVVLAVAGHFGIGEFRLYYGDDPHGCAKLEVNLKDKP